MPLQLRCPQCRKALTISDHLAGRSGKCPGCGARVDAPISAAAPPAAVATHAPPVQAIPIGNSARPSAGSWADRLAALRGRTWKFWVLTGLGCWAGGYMLLLLWSLNVAAWRQSQQLRANQSGGSGAHAAVETVLDRMGYSREACLICRSGRSQEARQHYSDDHGYGLCGACGAGQRANLRTAQNGGMASPADQQAAQRLFQTIQRRLGPNPSETEGAFLMSILASFDSPEWNSLYGPVK